MKLIGIALLILGIVGLLYGGFGYKRDRTVLEIGGIKATATEHKRFPIPPAAGVVALIAGAGLLVVERRRA